MLQDSVLSGAQDSDVGGFGLAGCSDDQLLGIISGARRQECRNAWILLTAIKEFARRAGTGLEGEFAADELASELHMSQASAAGQMEYSTTVAKRLPKTFAAMRAGLDGTLEELRVRAPDAGPTRTAGPPRAEAGRWRRPRHARQAPP